MKRYAVTITITHGDGSSYTLPKIEGRTRANMVRGLMNEAERMEEDEVLYVVIEKRVTPLGKNTYEEVDPIIDFEFKHPMGEAPKRVT